MEVFKNNVSLEATPTSDTHIVNKEYVDRLCGGQLPIGAIVPFSGSVIPYGYLLCDGQEISRAKYSTLFSVIGEIFGSGDGSTTFNVPDLRDKFPQGASGSNPVGTVKEAGLPNITGAHTTYDYGNSNSATGAFTKRIDNPNSSATIIASSEAPYTKFSFNASRSSSIYGNSDTVQPPSVCVNYIIRAKVAETTTLTGESYSTEEQVIGTWIDGKPLYRKTVSFGALPNSAEKKVAHNISNLKMITNIYGTAKTTTTNTYIMIDHNPDVNNFTFCYIEGDGIWIKATTDRSMFTQSYITLEYTKTTD